MQEEVENVKPLEEGRSRHVSSIVWTIVHVGKFVASILNLESKQSLLQGHSGSVFSKENESERSEGS